MTITPLPPLDRTSPSFRSDLDSYFGTALPAFAGQANALAANLSSLAAGGAYSFPYDFLSSTTLGDPGLGRLRFDATSQDATTEIRIDTGTVAGAVITGVFDELAAVTSAKKGSLRMVKVGDPSAWMLFDVLGMSATSGSWRNLLVVTRYSSTANPFSAGDRLQVYIERTGDKGDPGIYAYMKVSDRKASGTNGGVAVAGWQTRALNTTELNSIGGASLSANTVTLPAGAYDIRLRAPAKESTHKAALYNVTDSAYALIGSTSTPGINGSTDSFATGRLTIAATKTFQVRQYMASTSGADSQLGSAVGSGQLEVYSELEFFKVG